MAAFAADWAYTVDGSDLGDFEYENFNAACVVIKISGNNIHPGMAKDVMVNALDVAHAFHAALPAGDRPQHTQGHEGFYHLHQMKGSVENAELHYIVCDFDSDAFEQRKAYLRMKVSRLNDTLRADCAAQIDVNDIYRNMREKVEPHPHIIELALQAMRDCGVEPSVKPIRGGTDGSALSWKGLPCPNIFTGSYNYHGKHEFVSLNIMEQAVRVIMRLAELAGQKDAFANA